MRKLILLAALALVSIALLGQEQVPVQGDEPPQVQTVEPPAPPAQPQGLDLKNIRIPHSFIHAGQEYPSGDYRLVLVTKDGEPRFIVQNAQKETLFEEMAIIMTRGAGGTGARYRLEKGMTRNQEYFRVKVIMSGEWRMGYFLLKK